MFNGRSRFLGYMLIFTSSIAFAAKGIFAKILYAYGLDPVSLLALRFAVAMPFFWGALFIFQSEKVGLRDVLILILSGLVGLYASALADFYGLLFIDASLERVIIYTYPAMVVVLTSFFFKERLGFMIALSIAIIYIGLALTLKVWGASFKANMLGAGLCLFAAFVYSFSYIITESLGRRVSAIKIATYSTTAGTAAFIMTWAIKGANTPHDAKGWGLIFVLGFVTTFIPVVTQTVGIKILGAGRAAMASFIGPVFTAVMAWYMLGETMDAIQIIGMLVVMLGIYMTTVFKGNKKPEEVKEPVELGPIGVE